ncbi:Inner membrane protein yiaA [Escherichia coli]|uniref:Inner membrane protein yiaA n=1 Tax=Escherichia coli TaxID=562 RepID=A0A485J973_ECOLX|nr:Inner membrane protein yiaA [Escherichia coli]
MGGIVTYLLGLWNAEMQLNEKGYYFARTGIRTVFCGVLSKDRSGTSIRHTDHLHLLYDLPDCLYYLCCVTDGRSVECDVITSEKGFYGLAFSKLVGAVAVQKNI